VEEVRAAIDGARCLSPPPPAPLYVSASLAEVADVATDPATGIITFLSGNKAMHELALNFAASVYCLTRPFPFFMAPLDEQGRLELQRAAYMSVFHDTRAEAQFSDTESLFGQARYQAMARYKWTLAQELLLASGRPVLWFDPDIAVRRNPLMYFATLPLCDLTMQTEVAALELYDTRDEPQDGHFVPHASSHATRRLVGNVATLARVSVGRDLIFNTGVVLVQPCVWCRGARPPAAAAGGRTWLYLTARALLAQDGKCQRSRAKAAAHVSTRRRVWLEF